MGYDISIIDEQERVIELDEPHHIKGGRYVLGGTNEAELHVTFNYAKPLSDRCDGASFKDLHGLSVPKAIDMLHDWDRQLTGEPSDCYWADTEGNTKKAVRDLLSLCMMIYGASWVRVSA